MFNKVLNTEHTDCLLAFHSYAAGPAPTPRRFDLLAVYISEVFTALHSPLSGFAA
jgi:hypothetical protein